MFLLTSLQPSGQFSEPVCPTPPHCFPSKHLKNKNKMQNHCLKPCHFPCFQIKVQIPQLSLQGKCLWLALLSYPHHTPQCTQYVPFTRGAWGQRRAGCSMNSAFQCTASSAWSAPSHSTAGCHSSSQTQFKCGLCFQAFSALVVSPTQCPCPFLLVAVL